MRSALNFTSRLVWALLLVVLLLLPESRATAQISVQNADPAAGAPHLQQLNVQSFDYVWTTIRNKHWDPKLGGVDWDAVRAELRPKAERASTVAEGRAVLQEMIGRLHQSHFGILASDVYQSVQEPASGSPDGEEGWTGIDLRVIGGQALVTQVDANTPAAARSVHTGWQLVEVDGTDIAGLIGKVSETYKNSTMRSLMLSRTVLGKLNGAAGGTARARFLDGDERPVAVHIPRVKPKGTKAGFGYLPAHYVWLEWRKLDGNIGYIGFNYFLAPAELMANFEQAVKACMACSGVIIDLRGNPGGIGVMAMGMAGWFIDSADRPLGTMYTRETSLRFVVNPRLETYRGPLAVLVDGGTASTSEVFAEGIKDLGRARIFGTKTAGAALPSVFEKLPNGDGFQYAIANYVSEGGQTLEGEGVIPDVEVALTRAALLKGLDPVLDAACEWIGAKKKKTAGSAKPGR